MLLPRYLVVFASLLAFPPSAGAQGPGGSGGTVAEREPNNLPAAATPIALGDTFTGQIGSSGDIDYFAIDVLAGTELVIAGRNDISLGVGLVDIDGNRWLAWIPARVEYDGPLKYPITISGRYYIAVDRWDGVASYSLRVTAAPFQLGPADPLTTIAQSNQSYPFNRLVAKPAGDWYGLSGSWIMDVSNNGDATPFITNRRIVGFAVDGFGNLLTVGDGNRILRFTPDGAESVFYEWQYPYAFSDGAIAVGPDGDVWLAWTGDTVSEAQNRWIPVRMLYRFNPLGRVKSAIDLRSVAMDATGFRSAAFSPAGDLHFTTRAGLYKMTNEQPELLYRNGVTSADDGWPAGGPDALAFDQDGYLYFAGDDRILLFDQSYRVAQDTVAHIRGFAGALAFARDPGGAMSARLVAGRYAEIAQLNPNGVRTAGWTVGPQGPIATQMQVPSGALRRGMVDDAYADTLQVLAAAGPLTWTVTSGRLPAGLDLAASGVLAGIPMEGGTFTFEAQAANGGQSALGHFTIVITPHRVAAAVADIAIAVMGGPALSARDVQYLDSHGNSNGVLDVADLRAYLRAQGSIGATGRTKP